MENVQDKKIKMLLIFALITGSFSIFFVGIMAGLFEGLFVGTLNVFFWIVVLFGWLFFISPTVEAINAKQGDREEDLIARQKLKGFIQREMKVGAKSLIKIFIVLFYVMCFFSGASIGFWLKDATVNGETLTERFKKVFNKAIEQQDPSIVFTNQANNELVENQKKAFIEVLANMPENFKIEENDSKKMKIIYRALEMVEAEIVAIEIEKISKYQGITSEEFIRNSIKSTGKISWLYEELRKNRSIKTIMNMAEIGVKDTEAAGVSVLKF